MRLEDFLACLQEGEIPPEPPDGLARGGWDFEAALLDDADTWMRYLRARTACYEHGMWAIVDRIWTGELASWIGNRQVLEIMAGRGWLAKALALQGVTIIATDSGEWDERHQQSPAVFNVMPFEAVAAVATFGSEADLLLVSWPPYGDEAICQAAEAWGSGRPMIYIGEDDDGRNAPKRFFTHFEPREILDLPLKSWYGIHDGVFAGYYRAAGS